MIQPSATTAGVGAWRRAAHGAAKASRIAPPPPPRPHHTHGSTSQLDPLYPSHQPTLVAWYLNSPLGGLARPSASNPLHCGAPVSSDSNPFLRP